jgi:hypothetical protein
LLRGSPFFSVVKTLLAYRPRQIPDRLWNVKLMPVIRGAVSAVTLSPLLNQFCMPPS